MHRSTSRLLATTCVQVANKKYAHFIKKGRPSPRPFFWSISLRVKPVALATEIRVRLPDRSLLAIASFLFFDHFFDIKHQPTFVKQKEGSHGL